MRLADAMLQGWTMAKFQAACGKRCNLRGVSKQAEGRERANRSEETEAPK